MHSGSPVCVCVRAGLGTACPQLTLGMCEESLVANNYEMVLQLLSPHLPVLFFNLKLGFSFFSGL